MAATIDSGLKLGINGLGRIGKLTLWHHVGRKFFSEIVVNLGRPVGKSLADVAHYIERDSTYGWLHGYLYDHAARTVISDIDEARSSMRINGVPVLFLRKTRNPAQIGWGKHDVRLVVDTTGKFLNPATELGNHEASLRGHLTSGAEKVVLAAPFKTKGGSALMPQDIITTVMGVNSDEYDPRQHHIISCASCTTTCLAQMMRPLIDAFGTKRILSASMATVHAATSSQQVLDRLLEVGKSDLRKSHSIMNNIILASTDTANALRLVIPEMKDIPFIAESVRISTITGSLVILVINLMEDPADGRVDRETINAIYRQAADDSSDGYLLYSEQQNMSADIIGMPRAAAIIEGYETQTRTPETSADLSKVLGVPSELRASLKSIMFRIPVTQAIIYALYNNEIGSYVRMLGDCVAAIATKVKQQKELPIRVACNTQTKKDTMVTFLRKTMKITKTYVKEWEIKIGPLKCACKKAPREVEVAANKSSNLA